MYFGCIFVNTIRLLLLILVPEVADRWIKKNYQGIQINRMRMKLENENIENS